MDYFGLEFLVTKHQDVIREKKISKDFRIPSYGPLKGYGPTRILKFKDVKKTYSKFWKTIEISELTRRSKKNIIHELIIEARK